MIVGERDFTWHEVLEGSGKGYRGKRAMEVGQWQGSSCLGLEYRRRDDQGAHILAIGQR